MSITHLTASSIGSPKLRWTAFSVCAVVAFVAWLAHLGGNAHANVDMQRYAEMAAESHALCEKWGVPASSPRYADCLADIQDVRVHQSERIMQDIDY